MLFFKFYGWIFFPYIMIFIQWKRLGQKTRILAAVYSFFSLMYLMGNITALTQEPQTSASSDFSVSANSNHTTEINEATDNELDSKENKEAVLQFEKEVFSIEESIKPIMDRYQKAMDGLSNGTVSIEDAYTAASDAKKAAEMMSTDIGKIKINDDLHEDVRKLLQSVKTNFSTGYFTREKSFKSAMEYLEEQQPSLMQNFKEEHEMSQAFILKGTATLLEAKTKVGIDPTKE
ncbi:hypothetical protein [Paenibacillus sp. NPDC058174]|uniref:hypothetical protein n=1 Tax=Paenibacillus sp. NPDC058174 TaxID=3346366 RepID=UPI0036DEA6FD